VFHNAVKFTENGKISVTAAIMNPASRFVLFTITDTGEGIPDDFLPKLFKAFSREDESLTRLRDGLGLGLLVAKGISRKMGGDLWCERTSIDGPNKGSEFRIRLPLTPGDALSAPGTPLVNPNTPLITPPISNLPNPLSNWSLDSGQMRPSPFTGPPLHDEQSRSSPPPPPQPRMRDPEPMRLIPSSPSKRKGSKITLPHDKNLGKKIPLHILVAEDNRINRRLLISMLKKLGYSDIWEARDGAEAVEMMAMERIPPIDVILMDLWMPRMDGYEASERILSMPRYAKGPDGRKKLTILAVSADATEEAMQKTSRVGMEGFMTKPYKLIDLERLLVEFCTNKVEYS
jgi:CheY-like chemotaxis protein